MTYAPDPIKGGWREVLQSQETAGSFDLKAIARRAALDAEREVISKMLERTHGSRVKTATLLKISPRALFYKMKAMGLKRPNSNPA